MSSDKVTTKKPKIHNQVTGPERKKLSLPAVVVLLVTAVTLILFEILDDSTVPPAQSGRESTMTAEHTQTATKMVLPITVFDQLAKVMSSAEKVPFKANITTDGGFKGYWTQSGENYRFEDPSRNNIIIFNAGLKKLWVIDIAGKAASETICDTETANFYSRIGPTLFLEGFTAVNEQQTKNLEDILPGGASVTLSVTKAGLPDRWEGTRSDNTPCFIDWEYTRLNDVAPSEFELPGGITLFKPTSLTPGAKQS